MLHIIPEPRNFDCKFWQFDAQMTFILFDSRAKTNDRTVQDWHDQLIHGLNKWQGVPGNRVLWHVGKPRNHAAAQGAAENPHVPRFIPLVGVPIVVLHFICDGDAVEAAGNKQSILKDFDSKVAAGGQHGSDWGPRVCFRAVGLCAS